ncbi:MAG: hypothetical protein JWM87_1367 [Candidatus Eremiobacteraeota bacterium]|nr:hypothetical protein [Candidatus Eremiobacteraeota bacterium]
MAFSAQVQRIRRSYAIDRQNAQAPRDVADMRRVQAVAQDLENEADVQQGQRLVKGIRDFERHGHESFRIRRQANANDDGSALCNGLGHRSKHVRSEPAADVPKEPALVFPLTIRRCKAVEIVGEAKNRLILGDTLIEGDVVLCDRRTGFILKNPAPSFEFLEIMQAQDKRPSVRHRRPLDVLQLNARSLFRALSP